MIMKSLLTNSIGDDTECFVNIYSHGMNAIIMGSYWASREAAIAASNDELIGRLHVKMKRKIYD